MSVKYSLNGHTIDLLKPIQLYVNGTWIKVKAIVFYDGTLFVKNIDDKLTSLKFETVDLKWHFTIAEGKQIRNYPGKISFFSKLLFVLRSKSLF